jgi:hypothetical protein
MWPRNISNGILGQALPAAHPSEAGAFRRSPPTAGHSPATPPKQRPPGVVAGAAGVNVCACRPVPSNPSKEICSARDKSWSNLV